MVVPGCGIQAREPAQSPRMELNEAIGMVAANVKVEFVGSRKVRVESVQIQRVERRAVGAIIIL